MNVTHPQWLDCERDRMLARAPQAEINEAQMRADRIEEAPRAFLPWAIAAIIGLVVINAAFAAPSKLRADLRMIEAMGVR